MRPKAKEIIQIFLTGRAKSATVIEMKKYCSFTWGEIRNAMTELEDNGVLRRQVELGRENRFRYELTSDFREFVNLTKPYWKELLK